MKLWDHVRSFKMDSRLLSAKLCIISAELTVGPENFMEIPSGRNRRQRLAKSTKPFPPQKLLSPSKLFDPRTE
jgi:hypothetical protein